jgi:AraC-like DNA-binding protein
LDYGVALLETGYYTVEEVAELSGYTDPKYFSTSIKRYTGSSPIRIKNK